MKRIGNVWPKFIDKDTIREAITNAAKGKRKYRKVRKVLKNLDKSVDLFQEMMLKGAFRPSPYTTCFMKTEYGKEREIYKLPFFPDRVAQHDVSLCMRPRWTKALISDTYACIKDRGINCKIARYNLNRKVKRVLNKGKYRGVQLFCWKGDIRKCYPTVDNDVLAELNRKYCKDAQMLELLDLLNYGAKELDELAKSDGKTAHCNGLPIGNFLSQLWINVVLTELDRYIKEELKVKHYFRYMDDIVLISDDKHQLHEWQWRIMNFIWYVLHQELNEKRQVFPIGCNKYQRGIDYAGYVFRRESGNRKCTTRIRKRNKQAFARKRHNPLSVPSYEGIVQHCDGRNLIDKIVNQDNRMNIAELMAQNGNELRIERPFEGDNIKIDQIVDRTIDVLDFEVRPSEKKPGTDYLKMQIRFEGRKRFVGGGYQFLCDFLKKVDKKFLPLTNCIIRNKRGYYFDGTIDED